MLLKNTLIYIGVFCVLIVFLFYINFKEKNKIKSKYTFLFDKENVLNIEFKFKGNHILLYKKNNDWFVIKNNKNLLADKVIINNILLSFSELPELECFIPKSKLSIYGVINPYLYIKIKVKNNKIFEYFIGNLTPRKDFYYLRVGSEKTLYLIPATVIDNIGNSIFYYREKKILPYFKKEKVCKISIDIKNENFKVDFLKKNNQWFYNKMLLDDARINEMLITFGLFKAEKFIEGNKNNLERLGFNPANIKISISYENKNKDEIFIGFYNEKEGFFCVNNKSEILKVIYPGISKMIKPDILFYKNRTLFNEKLSNLLEITLKFNKKVISFNYIEKTHEFKLKEGITFSKKKDFCNKILHEITGIFMPFQADAFIEFKNNIKKSGFFIDLRFKNKKVRLDLIKKYNDKFWIAKFSEEDNYILIKPLLYQKLYLLFN